MPVLVTFRVKLIRVPAEPKEGVAILVTSISASLACTVAVALSVTLSPYSGWLSTSTWLVRVP